MGTRAILGSNGTNGNDGAQGPKGDQGNQGNPGHDGTNGSNGAQGPQGPAGPTGNTGAPGQNGTNGSNGAQGPQGPQGPPGLTKTRIVGAATTVPCTATSPNSTTLSNTTLVLDAGTYLLNGKVWLRNNTTTSTFDLVCSLNVYNAGVLFESDTESVTLDKNKNVPASFLLADSFNFQATVSLSCCTPSPQGYTYSDQKLTASTVNQVTN
jgi:hypothetical protein